MTDSQRFQLLLTEARNEYNALIGVINALPDTEQPTTEQQGRMTELRSTAAALETRVAAATETETRALQNAPEHTVDGAERERRELRSRSRLGRWFEAAISGRNVSGAEAETAVAYGCPDAIPLEMFERRAVAQGETRAVTSAPSTVDENLAGIVPARGFSHLRALHAATRGQDRGRRAIESARD